PDPEYLPLVEGGEDRVLPGDFGVEERFVDRGPLAEPHGIAIDTGPRDAVEPLGDVDPGELDLRRPTRGGGKPGAGETHHLGMLVAMAGHIEPGGAAHQLG